MTVEAEITTVIDEFVKAYDTRDIQAVLACDGDDLVSRIAGSSFVPWTMLVSRHDIGNARARSTPGQ